MASDDNGRSSSRANCEHDKEKEKEDPWPQRPLAAAAAAMPLSWTTPTLIDIWSRLLPLLPLTAMRVGPASWPDSCSVVDERDPSRSRSAWRTSRSAWVAGCSPARSTQGVADGEGDRRPASSPWTTAWRRRRWDSCPDRRARRRRRRHRRRRRPDATAETAPRRGSAPPPRRRRFGRPAVYYFPWRTPALPEFARRGPFASTQDRTPRRTRPND